MCVLHLFNSNRVQSFRYIREDEVSQMIGKISNLVTASKLTNVSELVMSLTSSMICRVAFCQSYNKEGYESRRFQGLICEAQAMMGGFFVSNYFPFTGWVDTITGMRARLEKNFKDFDLFYQELIDDHLNPSRPKSSQEDILDILLQLKKDPSLINLVLNESHIGLVLTASKVAVISPKRSH